MTKVKKGIVEYLEDRIKTKRQLLNIARKRGDKQKERLYEYGLELLRGIKRDIIYDPYVMTYYQNRLRNSE